MEKEPFGMSQEETEQNLDCLYDNVMAEVGTSDEPDYDSLSEMFEEIEAMGGDPFSMF